MNTAALKGLGLNDKAAKIYLTALSLGTASVQTIAHTAGIKRPTAYLHIEELVRAGFLEKIPLGKKDYYRATDPTMLQTRAEHSLALITEALPELNALQAGTGRPNVRVLEGARALTEVHRQIAAAPTIRFWADLAAFEKLFTESFDQLSSAISERHIRTREIIPDTPAGRKSAKRYAAIAGKYYSVRLAGTGQIYNNTAIYNDTVAIFRIHQYNLFVIVLEDPTITTTFKTIFDLAWAAAIPFIPRQAQQHNHRKSL